MASRSMEPPPPISLLYRAAAAFSSAYTLRMYIPLGPFPDNTAWSFGSVRLSYLLNSLVRAPALAVFFCLICSTR
jgi:hypothetical protein